MKTVLTIHEIDNAVIITTNDNPKFNGEFAYRLGKPEEVQQFLTRILKVMALDRTVKLEVIK